MELSLLITVGLIVVRILVGGSLVLAGVLKLKAGPRWFLHQILAYDLVKGKMAWWLTRGIPWAEILCGVLLIAGLLTLLVALFSFALLWGFTVAIVSTFLRGKPVDCGCFGRRTNTHIQQARWTVAYRNLTLMGLLIATYSFAPTLAVDAWLSRPLYHPGNSTLIQVWLIVFWLVSLVSILAMQQWALKQASKGQHNRAEATVQS